MTPEHEFELVTVLVPVIPATLLSIWALINQRRQTEPRLEVLPSPTMTEAVTGKHILMDELPGVAVRNLSSYPLRICNVGYRIGKKFYTFGKPHVNWKSTDDSLWPCVLEPHARVALHANFNSRDGLNFANAVKPSLGDRFLWEAGRAYVATECGRWFFSKRLSRKSVRVLRDAIPYSEA